MKSVGAYEAKTRLPSLLDEVARGKTITITKHGVPVALLVPAPETRRMGVDDALRALRQLRKDMTLGGLSIQELIDEGRR